jgi:hypothetical protein
MTIKILIMPGTHYTSDMVAVLGTICAIPPRNRNNNDTEDEVRFDLGNIVIFKVLKCLKLFRNRLWIKYKTKKVLI